MADITVDQFAEKRPLYEALRARSEDLIINLLSNNGISYHLVESRTKEIISFQEKLQRPGKSYSGKLEEITDICGCRIICYYQDDCSRIRDIINKEFDVKEEELSHRSENLDADRFGYISDHYVVSISPGRLKNTEWKPYKGLRLEIQVRTVIQHAWSAVSHAVQYKDESRIPSNLQRKLNRIAGLFELADEEFIAVRNQKRILLEEAASSLLRGDTSIQLSSASITEYMPTWRQLSLAQERAISAGFDVEDFEKDNPLTPDIYKFSVQNGLKTISDLDKKLEEYDESIFRKIVTNYFKDDDTTDKWVISKDFLIYLILLSRIPRVRTH